MHLVREHSHVGRSDVAARLEDGTQHYLGIAALKHGLAAITRIPGGMEAISRHTFGLARLAYRGLISIRHYNLAPVVRVHSGDYTSIGSQGGLVRLHPYHHPGELHPAGGHRGAHRLLHLCKGGYE